MQFPGNSDLRACIVRCCNSIPGTIDRTPQGCHAIAGSAADQAMKDCAKACQDPGSARLAARQGDEPGMLLELSMLTDQFRPRRPLLRLSRRLCPPRARPRAPATRLPRSAPARRLPSRTSRTHLTPQPRRIRSTERLTRTPPRLLGPPLPRLRRTHRVPELRLPPPVRWAATLRQRPPDPLPAVSRKAPLRGRPRALALLSSLRPPSPLWDAKGRRQRP